MHFRQFYLGCLAHASYLIGCDGEAAVVDPQRDVDIYLEDARQQGLKIRHVIETHLHADFVSGHRELAARTGAKVYFGAAAGARFEHTPVHEGDQVHMGDVDLRFLETPGHTPESISILVFDLAKSLQEPEAVLTGDTLFIGDVGRPDLLGARMTAAELAGLLYRSLHTKLMRLPDHVKVFPAHGPGSLCGRNISSEKSSTIGRERRFNYALKPMSEDEFVKMMTVDLPETPRYFGRDVEMNRSGPAILTQLPDVPPLEPDAAIQKMNQGGVLLDTRPSAQFGADHIAGAINIGLGGQFASWAGTLIREDSQIILVAESHDEVKEARIRLARVGMENVTGYLAGGIPAWSEAGMPLSSIEQIGVDELNSRLGEVNPPQVVDVRRPMEWQAGHISGARHIPLHELPRQAGFLQRQGPLAVICAGGYRSSIASGLLESMGFKAISNVIGGMSAWTAAQYAIVT
ncbi:MAG TPA: rhodanese-like domain-containing protein [Acidobacteriota bacterium]|nr:rhodanese-like domain-containing protein [Acidobacteriota bacterium]